MLESISIQELNFSYHTHKILQNINFEAKKGEFIGILGSNGSGKSTLIKQILGILEPDVGYIKIINKNITDYSHKQLANILGFVPQKSSLSMPLLVEDVLYMGRYSYLQNPLKGYDQNDMHHIDTIAKMLHIHHLKKRVILTLSGGEFQRVLLGRALASSPKILLLDEPTSALDINYAIEIMKICEKLSLENQITIIVVLHDLNLASLFCTKIFFLKKGEILYQGQVSELFNPEILEEVYGFACDVITHHGRPFIIPKKEKR
ncbi:ABC transporter ATP-binding protein [Helicobacter sp. 11S03491-1]|uniref:ABC transporter ATP-binding protein n=1 Tax=Helicobacter sp. 11S03491-1 TaxID=1476196 RepID=UPI000BA5D00A|nr:ABC transporter ATP-binding protein [Helicobacter sp. 11S03491-1]PAF43294.1 heme ABC transporter ATP-binding protein [Helicobacter sp. 11S03491-1]